jgi:hypothetical protein
MPADDRRDGALRRIGDAPEVKYADSCGKRAGLSIDEDAREMASRLGMYVIEMAENTKNITVIKPAGPGKR